MVSRKPSEGLCSRSGCEYEMTVSKLEVEADVETCSNRTCITCGFTSKIRRQVLNRKLSQWGGSLYGAVDDFVTVEPLKINRIQQRSIDECKLLQTNHFNSPRFN